MIDQARRIIEPGAATPGAVREHPGATRGGGAFHLFMDHARDQAPIVARLPETDTLGRTPFQTAKAGHRHPKAAGLIHAHAGPEEPSDAIVRIAGP